MHDAECPCELHDLDRPVADPLSEPLAAARQNVNGPYRTEDELLRLERERLVLDARIEALRTERRARATTTSESAKRRVALALRALGIVVLAATTAASLAGLVTALDANRILQRELRAVRRERAAALVTAEIAAWRERHGLTGEPRSSRIAEGVWEVDPAFFAERFPRALGAGEDTRTLGVELTSSDLVALGLVRGDVVLAVDGRVLDPRSRWAIAGDVVEASKSAPSIEVAVLRRGEPVTHRYLLH